MDGNVWKVRRKGQSISWAVKFHNDRSRYKREVACYELLKEKRVFALKGFDIPILLHADPAWMAIEMSIVVRPYVLDFAQAFLGTPPDFPDEVWQERLATWEENYGEDWAAVKRVLTSLKALGIHYLDVHHGNIATR